MRSPYYSCRERQCRDLWKLRTTLHNDSCNVDDWSNYHQRLNKRYDSGYKSLEQQLSSSLEGNLINQGVNLSSPGAVIPSGVGIAASNGSSRRDTRNENELERPRSGCSRLLDSNEKLDDKDNSSKCPLTKIDSLILMDEVEISCVNSSENVIASGRESKCSLEAGDLNGPRLPGEVGYQRIVTEEVTPCLDCNLDSSDLRSRPNSGGSSKDDKRRIN